MMPLITKNQHPSCSVRNLGVIFDPSVDMEDHIKKDIQDMSCPFNQHKYKISSYLDREPTGAIIRDLQIRLRLRVRVRLLSARGLGLSCRRHWCCRRQLATKIFQ